MPKEQIGNPGALVITTHTRRTSHGKRQITTDFRIVPREDSPAVSNASFQSLQKAILQAEARHNKNRRNKKK